MMAQKDNVFHLSRASNEGSPGKVSRGLRHAHVVAETRGQLDRPSE